MKVRRSGSERSLSQGTLARRGWRYPSLALLASLTLAMPTFASEADGGTTEEPPSAVEAEDEAEEEAPEEGNEEERAAPEQQVEEEPPSAEEDQGAPGEAVQPEEPNAPAEQQLLIPETGAPSPPQLGKQVLANWKPPSVTSLPTPQVDSARLDQIRRRFEATRGDRQPLAALNTPPFTPSDLPLPTRAATPPARRVANVLKAGSSVPRLEPQDVVETANGAEPLRDGTPLADLKTSSSQSGDWNWFLGLSALAALLLVPIGVLLIRPTRKA